VSSRNSWIRKAAATASAKGNLWFRDLRGGLEISMVKSFSICVSGIRRIVVKNSQVFVPK